MKMKRLELYNRFSILENGMQTALVIHLNRLSFGTINGGGIYWAQ